MGFASFVYVRPTRVIISEMRAREKKIKRSRGEQQNRWCHRRLSVLLNFKEKSFHPGSIDKEAKSMLISLKAPRANPTLTSFLLAVFFGLLSGCEPHGSIKNNRKDIGTLIYVLRMGFDVVVALARNETENFFCLFHPSWLSWSFNGNDEARREFPQKQKSRIDDELEVWRRWIRTLVMIFHVKTLIRQRKRRGQTLTAQTQLERREATTETCPINNFSWTENLPVAWWSPEPSRLSRATLATQRARFTSSSPSSLFMSTTIAEGI